MKARNNFILPEKNEDQDDEAYGFVAAEAIMSQVKQLLEDKETQANPLAYEIDLCQQLVAFSEQQEDSNIAYLILFEATQLAQLALSIEAKNIIFTAYNNEKFVRAPLMDDPTLECINEQKKKSSFIVMQFLTNPKWLLCWFEKAAAAETSRVITTYIHPNTSYWAALLEQAEKERAKNATPGFATICFLLINAAELNDEDVHYLLTAFNNPEVCSANLQRVLASAKARIRYPASFIPDEDERKTYTLDTIRAASGFFINSPCLSLTKANFSKLEINGAIFNQSNLIENNFQSCAATFAKFERCLLNGSDFSNSDLSYASFANSNLTNVNFATACLNGTIFTNAKLFGVNFSEADFRGADFTGCDLINMKNIFISRSAFRMDSLETTFDGLLQKISDHAFIAELRGAITRDLIDYCTACLRQRDNHIAPNVEILSCDKALKILRQAYSHALFSDHRNLKIITDAVNTVVDIGSNVVSWGAARIGLYSTPKDEDKNAISKKQVETSAQVDIRIAIEFLVKYEKEQVEDEQIRITRLNRQPTSAARPSPPKHSPAYAPN